MITRTRALTAITVVLAVAVALGWALLTSTGAALADEAPSDLPETRTVTEETQPRMMPRNRLMAPEDAPMHADGERPLHRNQMSAAERQAHREEIRGAWDPDQDRPMRHEQRREERRELCERAGEDLDGPLSRGNVAE